jgi:hypothetical protein
VRQAPRSTVSSPGVYTTIPKIVKQASITSKSNERPPTVAKISVNYASIPKNDDTRPTSPSQVRSYASIPKNMEKPANEPVDPLPTRKNPATLPTITVNDARTLPEPSLPGYAHPTYHSIPSFGQPIPVGATNVQVESAPQLAIFQKNQPSVLSNYVNIPNMKVILT